MAKYIITKDSLHSLGENKVGFEVKFIDEVNGKPDCVCYHEVDSTDENVIAEHLSVAALEYEGREVKTDNTSSIETGIEVKAEIKAANG